MPARWRVSRSVDRTSPTVPQYCFPQRTSSICGNVIAFILAKLREHGWNVSKTAEAIDTPRSNLYKKIEQYNIKREGGVGVAAGDSAQE